MTGNENNATAQFQTVTTEARQGSQIRTQKINVRSFDFDGCVFNRDFIDSYEENRLIIHNQTLLNEVAENVREEKFDEVVLMVGSNRQSLSIDDANRRGGKGSCFPALKGLHLALQTTHSIANARIDGYLLADTYGDKPSGENFRHAVIVDSLAYGQRCNYEFKFSHWLFDETKLTILYAQTHKLASENPNAQIVYDFYDDKHQVILPALGTFFQQHHDLLPSNVTLRIHHYEGGIITKLYEIKGSGDIDHNFHGNIKLIARILGIEESFRDSHNISAMLQTDNRLAQFKEERCLAKPAISTVAFVATQEPVAHESPVNSVVTQDATVGATGCSRDIKDELSAAIAVIVNKKESTEKLKTALAALDAQIRADIEKQTKSCKTYASIMTSPINKLAKDTTEFLTQLKEKIDADVPKQELEAFINQFENNCKKMSGVETVLRVLAVAVISLISCFVGMVVGAGIGLATGNPIASSVCVGIGGTIGATIGFGVAQHLLFKPNTSTQCALDVADEARKSFACVAR